MGNHQGEVSRISHNNNSNNNTKTSKGVRISKRIYKHRVVVAFSELGGPPERPVPPGDVQGPDSVLLQVQGLLRQEEGDGQGGGRRVVRQVLHRRGRQQGRCLVQVQQQGLPGEHFNVIIVFFFSSKFSLDF